MKKVLVVDDSRGWLEFHKKNLNEFFKDEIEIDEATSARSAYDLIFAYIDEPYDLIITDLQMEYDFDGKFAGEWLVEQIKLLKQYAKTKVVISSGSLSIRQIAESFNVDCMPKRIIVNDTSLYKNLL